MSNQNTPPPPPSEKKTVLEGDDASKKVNARSTEAPSKDVSEGVSKQTQKKYPPSPTPLCLPSWRKSPTPLLVGGMTLALLFGFLNAYTLYVEKKHTLQIDEKYKNAIHTIETLQHSLSNEKQRTQSLEKNVHDLTHGMQELSQKIIIQDQSTPNVHTLDPNKITEAFHQMPFGDKHTQHIESLVEAFLVKHPPLAFEKQNLQENMDRVKVFLRTQHLQQILYNDQTLNQADIQKAYDQILSVVQHLPSHLRETCTPSLDIIKVMMPHLSTIQELYKLPFDNTQLAIQKKGDHPSSHFHGVSIDIVHPPHATSIFDGLMETIQTLYRRILGWDGWNFSWIEHYISFSKKDDVGLPSTLKHNIIEALDQRHFKKVFWKENNTMISPTRVMQRTLRVVWAILRLSLILALAFWLFQWDNRIQIYAFGWDINMTAGASMLALLALTAITWLCFGVLRGLFSLRQFLRHKWHRHHIKRAGETFDAGINAFFSEEYKDALHHFSSAAHHNPKRYDLYCSLMAISAWKSGQLDIARRYTHHLFKTERFSFIGYFVAYHLWENAHPPLDLLEEARYATKDHPWILKKLLESYIQDGSPYALDKAKGLLLTLYDKKHIDKTERRKKMAQILWMQAEHAIEQHNDAHALNLAKQSLGQDDVYDPAVLFLSSKETPKNAQKMLMKAFIECPTAALTDALLNVVPHTTENFHTLEHSFKDSLVAEHLFFLATLAFHAQLWGRSQQLLEQIQEEDKKDLRFYTLQQQLYGKV